MNYENYLSDRVKCLKASAIREMFKLMADPEIISLAGGSPDPSLFPSEELAEIAKDILLNNPVQALQYGTTDGYKPFKEAALSMAECGKAAGDCRCTPKPAPGRFFRCGKDLPELCPW